MSDELHNSIKIAVVEEQIVGLREQQRAHNLATQNRFDGMERKLDELTAIINRGKGAYAASLVIAGLIGGIVIKIAHYMAEFFVGRP